MKKDNIRVNNLYVCYCLLKEEVSSFSGNRALQLLNQSLDEAQGFYEREGARVYEQAFVFGNGEAAVRPFAVYDHGFRAAMDDRIRRYSLVDALLLSLGVLKDLVDRNCSAPGSDDICEEYRLVLLSDYSFNADDAALEIIVRELNALKRRCSLRVCCYSHVQGEVYGKLTELIDCYGLE